jgi:hypothetical protein
MLRCTKYPSTRFDIGGTIGGNIIWLKLAHFGFKIYISLGVFENFIRNNWDNCQFYHLFLLVMDCIGHLFSFAQLYRQLLLIYICIYIFYILITKTK